MVTRMTETDDQLLASAVMRQRAETLSDVYCFAFAFWDLPCDPCGAWWHVANATRANPQKGTHQLTAPHNTPHMTDANTKNTAVRVTYHDTHWAGKGDAQDIVCKT